VGHRPPVGIERGAKRRRGAADLYRSLETRILPLYRAPGDGWPRLMRSTIAFNASFFNTQRMLQQYVAMAYAR
jgi:starch phosphorylase